ncbi:LacI family DNA-binding transcriptional regulator [Sutcliffiella cohnii]
MTTIRDVSKFAGVSVATVSRVLNNSENVQPITRSKVEHAIKELDYKPNAVARTLFKKKSNSIGLIVPDITNPFFPDLARAVEDTARSLNYKVILCNSDGDLEKEKEYIEVLSQNQVDGLIVTSTNGVNDHLKDLNMPVVALDRTIGNDIPCVYVDNYEGGRLAGEILYLNGGKQIAQIRGPHNLITAEERARGFNDFWNSKGITPAIYESEFSFKEAITVANRLFDEMREVDSIFTGNDLIGVAVVNTAIKRGIKIPQDLRVLGYDGIEIGKMMIPSLSTIQQPIYGLGREVTKLLLDLSKKTEVKETSICMPLKYIKRETTLR